MADGSSPAITIAGITLEVFAQPVGATVCINDLGETETGAIMYLVTTSTDPNTLGEIEFALVLTRNPVGGVRVTHNGECYEAQLTNNVDQGVNILTKK